MAGCIQEIIHVLELYVQGTSDHPSIPAATKYAVNGEELINLMVTLFGFLAADPRVGGSNELAGCCGFQIYCGVLGLIWALVVDVGFAVNGAIGRHNRYIEICLPGPTNCYTRSPQTKKATSANLFSRSSAEGFILFTLRAGYLGDTPFPFLSCSIPYRILTALGPCLSIF